MTIIQAQARIYRLPGSALLAHGRCALYIASAPTGGNSYVAGTMIVEWEGEERPGSQDEVGHRVQIDDGRWLDVIFTRHAADPGGPEVLRFRGSGPLRPAEQWG